MSQKNKRKGTPTRPIWQVLAVVLVMGAIALAVWWYYTDIPANNDGADIIFIREEGNRISNIYTLDIDDPEAEAIPLTDYTPNNPEYLNSIAYPDDLSWVGYIEIQQNYAAVKKIDMATGEISTLFECDTDEIQGCWMLDVSPDGRYIVFGGSAKQISGGEMGWLIDLQDISAPPLMIEDGGGWQVTFLDNETLAYWEYETFTVVTYDIASGGIKHTEIEDFEPRFSPDGSHIAKIDFQFEDDTMVFDYTVFNLNDDTQNTFTSPYGDSKEPLVTWHPDNTQFLVVNPNYSDNPMKSTIALIDSSTGEGQVLVEQSEYVIMGLAWNPDGTQFLFWSHPANEFGYEGEIWVYDMESGEARPLNQVGSSVGWLN